MGHDLSPQPFTNLSTGRGTWRTYNLHLQPALVLPIYPTPNPTQVVLHKKHQPQDMDPWSWLTTLPTPEDWPPSSPPQTLELVSSSAKSMVLKAERTAGSGQEAMVTISVCLQGINSSNPMKKTLWVSDSCRLSTHQHSSFDPLLLQLLQEVTARAPKVSSDVPVPLLDVSFLPFHHDGGDDDDRRRSSEFSNFFELVLHCRLFWLCTCDASADVGSLYFQMLSSNIRRVLDCKSVVREMLVSAGVDWEVCFMRAVGYMLAKLCILKELSPSPSSSSRMSSICSHSYAVEQYGLWVLRGYVPVIGMDISHQHGQAILDAREPLLRYALAHQQLEAVVQLGYSTCLRDDRYIQISIQVDNIRINMARLRFGEQEVDSTTPDERHFPSRVQVHVAPHPCSTLSHRVVGLSLAKSTSNPEKEVQREQTLKGKLNDFGKKTPVKVKAVTTTSVKERATSWHWEQEAEGNMVLFEGVLCDNSTGIEVATWRPPMASGDPRGGMKQRYIGPRRAFSKGGRLVVRGDEDGGWVSWRVGREMEGKVLRWMLGGKVWVSYCANEVKSTYFETRCVEWKEELELPIPSQKNQKL